MTAILNFVTVRGREWGIEVPALLLEDGLTLEFAAGNQRPRDEDDVLAPAAPWQVQEFKAMRRQSL